MSLLALTVSPHIDLIPPLIPVAPPNVADGGKRAMIHAEPYPQPSLTKARLERNLVQLPDEEVNLDLFAVLVAGEILFIHSSHL
jgi:hypothetical protein